MTTTAQPWQLSHRADHRALPIADAHYNRQKPGTPQFVPPGRCLVLLTDGALWVTSWPFAEYVKHAWPGAWVCSCFRRESHCPYLASDLIRQALAATCFRWSVPKLGIVTFIDPDHVKPTMVRGRPVYGWTYRKVGFVDADPPRTKGGLIAIQLWPDKMPAPRPARDMQLTLIGMRA